MQREYIGHIVHNFLSDKRMTLPLIIHEVQVLPSIFIENM